MVLVIQMAMGVFIGGAALFISFKLYQRLPPAGSDYWRRLGRGVFWYLIIVTAMLALIILSEMGYNPWW
jgi:hypothetical protein